MKPRSLTRSFRDLPSTFNGLAQHHPPRPIRDEVDLENASEMINALAGHPLSKDQEDYLEVLSELVGAFDDAHYAKKLSRVSPVSALNDLVKHNGMTASALGELLRQRSLGSKLLRGERQLSKAHIRALADHFKVSADLFLA